MSRLLQFAALLLAALWLPATLHCRLEGLGLDTLFACADQPGQHEHGEKSACADDGCQTVESGQFVLAQSRVDLSALSLLAAPDFACLVPVAPPALASEIFAFRPDEPPPLRRPWQFARRAALPARAPDRLKA